MDRWLSAPSIRREDPGAGEVGYLVTKVPRWRFGGPENDAGWLPGESINYGLNKSLWKFMLNVHELRKA